MLQLTLPKPLTVTFDPNSTNAIVVCTETSVICFRQPDNLECVASCHWTVTGEKYETKQYETKTIRNQNNTKPKQYETNTIRNSNNTKPNNTKPNNTKPNNTKPKQYETKQYETKTIRKQNNTKLKQYETKPT